MKLVITFAALLVTLTISAQTKCENYLFKEVGYISIPNSLELQAGKFKEFAEEVQKAMSKKFKYEVTSRRIVFQNKGVNKFDNKTSDYTSVIIDTEIGNYGDYTKVA